MKKTKLLISFILVGLGLLTLPSFAAELNSGNVTESPLNCYTGATTCLLSNRGITAIASGTFINHTNLETLYLNNNEISSIESGDFSGLGNLETLELYENSISSIESGGFSGLVSLQELNLSENSISSIESGDFVGLESLIELRLDNNSISSIESGGFSGLENLTGLNLSDNSINSIESGDFSGLDNLIYLRLSDNEINSIESGDFSRLGNLQTLWLNSNSINSIESGDFSELGNLTYLYLHSNEINNIENGDFSRLGNLQTLWLGYNGIKSIESGDFSGLASLKELSLYSNEINSIECDDFSELENLQNLNLSRNKIEEIETGSFDNLTGLIIFSLSFNKILTLPSNIFDKLENVNFGYIMLGNCIDSNIIFTHTGIQSSGWQLQQKVCSIFQYTPTIETTGPVTGELIFIGGQESERNILNQNHSGHKHTWTENGEYTFNLVSMPIEGYTISSNAENINIGEDIDYIHNDASIVTGVVTRIIDDEESPVISGVTNGSTHTTSATFSVTDNVEVTSVTLDGENLTERTEVEVTEIGDHTLIASDAAGNTTIVSFTIKKKRSGGGGSISKDICPDGDNSTSYYDEKCEGDEIAEAEVDKEEKIESGKGTNSLSPAGNEMESAYKYAKEKGITTTEDIAEFEPESQLIRMHLAKMISEFAINVMGKEEMTEGVDGCSNFEDMAGETKDMKGYATMACKLGLMGRESDQKTTAKNFNPEMEVNRAQFGTILSRLLRGQRYAIEDGSIYYRDHLEALKKDGILSVIDPEMEELRGWVALMLYRVGLAK